MARGDDRAPLAPVSLGGLRKGGALDHRAGHGTGLAQPQTVHGRLRAQPIPSPELYTDTVVVTVDY